MSMDEHNGGETGRLMDPFKQDLGRPDESSPDNVEGTTEDPEDLAPGDDDALVDEVGKESFPASDPPPF
jgi:hypothetical protein